MYIQSSGHHSSYHTSGCSGLFLGNISVYAWILSNDHAWDLPGTKWEHLLQNKCLILYLPSTLVSQSIVYTLSDPPSLIHNFLASSSLWSWGLLLVWNQSCQTFSASRSHTFLDLDKYHQVLVKLPTPNNNASALDPTYRILLPVSSFPLKYDLPHLSWKYHPI